MGGLFNSATHILLRVSLETEKCSLNAAKVHIQHTSTLVMGKAPMFSNSGDDLFEGH